MLERASQRSGPGSYVVRRAEGHRGSHERSVAPGAGAHAPPAHFWLERSPASSTLLLTGVSAMSFEQICQYFQQKADRPLPLGSAGGLPNDGPIAGIGGCPPAGLHSGSPPHPPRPAERRRHRLVIPSPVPSSARAPRPSSSTYTTRRSLPR